jgi:hypothetical protein
MQADLSPAARSERRVVFECKADDGFRTSPLVFAVGAADVPGLNAATHQLSEHTLRVHDGDPSVGFVSVDLPAEVQD